VKEEKALLIRADQQGFFFFRQILLSSMPLAFSPSM
jgi:hypothetical protein